MTKQSQLKRIKDENEKVILAINSMIERLGSKSAQLSEILKFTQIIFDNIRNRPSELVDRYNEIKQVQLEWKREAEKIDEDYQLAMKNGLGAGAAGVAAGVGVVALGPTVAMGLATTFGVAATGTPIALLNGAAAINAALAWLGGGSLAVGGAGMAGGKILLALAGPVGWSIAGLSLVASGTILWMKFHHTKQLEEIFVKIGQRDLKSYELSKVELSERMIRMDIEINNLYKAISNILTFGNDYTLMTELQKYELGAYVNLMNSASKLLVNPIQGLIPKYTEVDYQKYLVSHSNEIDQLRDKQNLIIYLSNLLYDIELEDSEREELYKFFSKNKEFIETIKIDKKEFDYSAFSRVFEAIELKKSNTN